MPAAWLVLPTYNEAENLERIVRAALPELASAASEPHVLIVDDGSPDGTGDIADRLAAELPEVEVLHRTAKEGLGRAYLAGFERALASGADLVLEMDADFSHDPRDLPRLIAAASEADLVLGSRYVRGGGVTDWGWFRRMLSRGGSWYARVVLGVPVRDLTGGFKCFRREVVESFPLDEVRSRGYAFQIELTYRAIRTGFRVHELPIRFIDRQVGGSKMSRTIVLEAIWKVPLIRLAALGGDLLERRRDHAARAAPGCPEVDEHRLLVLEHLGLEVAVGHFVDVSGHVGSSFSVGRFKKYSGGVSGVSPVTRALSRPPRRRSWGSSSTFPARGRGTRSAPP